MTALTSAVGVIVAQFTDTIDVISSNALMLIPVGVFVIGASIGLVKRVIG